MTLQIDMIIDGILRQAELRGCKDVDDIRWFTDKLSMVCSLHVLGVKIK